MNERKWFDIKAKAEGNAEVWIYDEIGDNFWGEGLSAKQFAKDLAALDVEHIDVRVNSPGGNVFDGQAIYNALLRHPARKTAHIDGLAASIASAIPLACDGVVMAETALFMVHNSWGFAVGNAADLREYAVMLDKIDDTLTGVYARKTERGESEIRALMAAETWMSASEALDFGFVDTVGEALAVAAFDLSRFRNPPKDTTVRAAEAPAVAPAAEATAQPRDRVDRSRFFIYRKP